MTKFTEVDNNTKVELEPSSQANKSTNDTSFNWANITEKDLQSSEIWEDILVEQAKTRETTIEESIEIETQQNNNTTNAKHVSNQAGDDLQDADPRSQVTQVITS